MSVDYKHRDFEANEKKWIKITDCLKGQDAIKAKKETYLPKPNPDDASYANTVRYDNYLKRAVFFNVAKRTLDSMVGTAFRKFPTLDTDGVLSYVEKDIDGAGISIYQQSQKVLSNVLSHGRCGLLVDFPSSNEAVSVADMQNGYTRANCLFYEASSIRNWQTARIGARIQLSLVVLSEVADEIDGFESELIERYRVLKLEDGAYKVEIWEDRSNDGKASLHLVEEYFPRMSNGQLWKEIPFTFIGSENNDYFVDQSPLYGLVEINLAHYRNSADYEDSVFIIGQPQPYITGLTEQWAEMLERKGVCFGSRSPIPLPVDSKFGIAQAGANVLVREAMKDKENQMVALGARLLQQGSAIKTATEAQGDKEAETSILALAVSNVNEAYSYVAEWMNMFMGSGSFIYEINGEFVELSMDAQKITSLVAAWQQRAFPKSDLWQAFRRSGLIDDTKTDEEIDAEISVDDAGLAI